MLGVSAGAAEAGDHPPAVSPEPLGAAMHRIFNAQNIAAGQDHFTFYECEWLNNSARLGPAGNAHLDQVVRCLAQTRYPVVIEPNPDPNLNGVRRDVIVNALLAAGVLDARDRVITARPLAEGLYGEEAVPIYPLMITTRFRNNGLLGGVGRGFGGFGGTGAFGGFGVGGGLGFGLGVGGVGYGGYGGGGFFGGGLGYGGGYPATTPTQGYRGLGY
jgi:hypothetical protein